MWKHCLKDTEHTTLLDVVNARIPKPAMENILKMFFFVIHLKRPIKEITSLQEFPPLKSLEVSADGKYIVAASQDNEIILYNIKEKRFTHTHDHSPHTDERKDKIYFSQVIANTYFHLQEILQKYGMLARVKYFAHSHL